MVGHNNTFMGTEMQRFLASGILLLSFAASSIAASADDPSGIWLTQAGDAKVAVSRCGSGLCGRIVWLKSPIDSATGKPQVDDKNPNLKLAKRPVIGLQPFHRYESARTSEMVRAHL